LEAGGFVAVAVACSGAVVGLAVADWVGTAVAVTGSFVASTNVGVGSTAMLVGASVGNDGSSAGVGWQAASSRIKSRDRDK
jgi:hypothetical protein